LNEVNEMDENKITLSEEIYLHNDCISRFNNELYRNIFSVENIVSTKKAIMFDDKKYYGYFVEKDQERYFMIDIFVKNMPVKVKDFREGDYKGDVFRFVDRVESIVIPSVKKFEFRELIKKMTNFKHSNPKHYLLSQIIDTVAYCDRINARITSDPGFGKDSGVNIISRLNGSVANIYSATFAKLEFSLTNKLIIFNEMGNLKPDDKFSMQEFLLAVGAYFNEYTKRTRKTATTQEQYDISTVSLLIFYNLPHYYIEKAQEYFDQMFPDQVANRFIPFVFEGTLITNFGQVFDMDLVMQEHKQDYKDLIATINYYRQNNLKTIKYVVDKSIVFSDELKRYERTFNTIMKYISEYSESQEEFDDLTKELYKCYKNYGKLLVKSR
jgi:hypothetical protein